MCQKGNFVKRMFVILRHTSSPQPHVWRVIPPVTQAEEIYRVHAKSPRFLSKVELNKLGANPLEDSYYSMIPLELPVNWLQSLPVKLS